MRHVLIFTSSVIFLYVVWDYVARVSNLPYRPSKTWLWIGDEAQHIWKVLGAWVAYYSSFLTYFKFKIVIDVLSDMFVPAFHIFMGWGWAVESYFDAAGGYSHPFLVFIGSFLILLAITEALVFYFNRPKFPFIRSLLQGIMEWDENGKGVS